MSLLQELLLLVRCLSKVVHRSGHAGSAALQCWRVPRELCLGIMPHATTRWVHGMWHCDSVRVFTCLKSQASTASGLTGSSGLPAAALVEEASPSDTGRWANQPQPVSASGHSITFPREVKRMANSCGHPAIGNDKDSGCE